MGQVTPLSACDIRNSRAAWTTWPPAGWVQARESDAGSEPHGHQLVIGRVEVDLVDTPTPAGRRA